MNEKKQLCPNCQTGLESLKLDNRSPCCPYLYFHNGTACAKYKALKQIHNALKK